MSAIKIRRSNGLYYAEVRTATGVKNTGRYVSAKGAETAGRELEKKAANGAPAPAALMKRF